MKFPNTSSIVLSPPPFVWIHSIFFTMLLIIVKISTLSWRTPNEVSLGDTLDISEFLHFEWWQQVYYMYDDVSGFPSSKQKLVYWVGTTENCGNELTYLIHTPDAKHIICRIVFRPDTEPTRPTNVLALILMF